MSPGRGAQPAGRVQLHGSLDHLILATGNVERTARRLREQLGLGSVVGGSHPWGTANWIVPLDPPSYLELLYVEDRSRLLADESGPDLARSFGTADVLLGWAVRATDIVAVARALGTPLEAGETRRADGSVSRWTTTGLADDGNGAFPFFVDYDDGADRVARFEQLAGQAAHERTAGPVRWIEVAGGEPIRARFADLAVDVEIRWAADQPGREPGVRAIGLSLGGADATIRPGRE